MNSVNKFFNPLMKNNILTEDINSVINFLKSRQSKILTHSSNVNKFEEEWSKWLGVKYSVFLNSESSANLLTLLAVKILYGTGEIIITTLTWISDIASVIQNNFKPVFVDINPRTLRMNDDEVLKRITKKTKAVFITHAQGFNGLSDKLILTLKKKLDKDITNTVLDDIYNKAKNSGAIGGKILRAGAGGFFLFYVPQDIKKYFLQKMNFLTEVPFF